VEPSERTRSTGRSSSNSPPSDKVLLLTAKKSTNEKKPHWVPEFQSPARNPRVVRVVKTVGKKKKGDGSRPYFQRRQSFRVISGQREASWPIREQGGKGVFLTLESNCMPILGRVESQSMKKKRGSTAKRPSPLRKEFSRRPKRMTRGKKRKQTFARRAILVFERGLGRLESEIVGGLCDGDCWPHPGGQS